MKRLFCSLMIIIMIMFVCAPLVIAQKPVSEMTEDDAADLAKDLGVKLIDIKAAGGIWPWIKQNILAAIMSLFGLGSFIIWLTPSKKDDKWYDKYILRYVRILAQIISLGTAGSKPPG